MTEYNFQFPRLKAAYERGELDCDHPMMRTPGQDMSCSRRATFTVSDFGYDVPLCGVHARGWQPSGQSSVRPKPLIPR